MLTDSNLGSHAARVESAASDSRSAASRMEEAAEKMNRAADRMEAAAHRMGLLFEDGYGSNALRLLEALESIPRPERGDSAKEK